MWAKVQSVQADTPASRSGIQGHDFIKRINGMVVFHMTPDQVNRHINDSGTTLYLDIERYSPSLWHGFCPVKRNGKYLTKKWSEQKVLVIEVAGLYSIVPTKSL